MQAERIIHESKSAACRIVPFPPARRADMIREVCAKLLSKRTVAAADRYRYAVASTLFAQFEALGIAEAEQDEAVGAFFNTVEEEMWR